MLDGRAGRVGAEVVAALQVARRPDRTHREAAAAVREVADSGFAAQGGPLAWLMFDELLTAEMRMVPFLRKFCLPANPVTLADWETLARRYLQAVGRWEYIRPFLAPLQDNRQKDPVYSTP